MKKLEKATMKKITGGIKPPKNGVCYGLNENCTLVSGCCSGLYCNNIFLGGGVGKCGPYTPLP